MTYSLSRSLCFPLTVSWLSPGFTKLLFEEQIKRPFGVSPFLAFGLKPLHKTVQATSIQENYFFWQLIDWEISGKIFHSVHRHQFSSFFFVSFSFPRRKNSIPKQSIVIDRATNKLRRFMRLHISSSCRRFSKRIFKWLINKTCYYYPSKV